MTDHRLTLTQFTPAEAERITGVSTMAQRDWRRRGIIVKGGEGHARYNLFELGELLTLKMLSDRGVSLAEASGVVDWCGMGIGYQALSWIDAYEGDHLEVGRITRLLTRREKYSAETLKTLDQAAESVGTSLDHDEPEWGDMARWLTHSVYRQQFRTGVIPGSLFIWWANGEHLFHESFDKARAGMTSNDPKLAGPALVLDFQNLASLLIDRAGRAFVHVEIPELPATPVEEPTSDDVGNLSAGAAAPAQQKETTE